MNDFMMMREFFGSQGIDWVVVSMLLSLFAVLIFRPEQIRKRRTFRWACGLLALSILAPSISRLILGNLGVGVNNMYGNGDPTVAFAMSLVAMMQPAVLAASVFLALLAISPRTNPKGNRGRENEPAKKHPLD